MLTLKVTLKPLSAFGTPIAGDTLFGQLCWAIRERFGETRLCELLRGYTDGDPFLSLSDGFPAEFLPKPSFPASLLGENADTARRKILREKDWLPAADCALPLRDWLERAQGGHGAKTEVLTQNTINRLTGTTGTGPFAPRQVERIAFPAGRALDLYAVLDEQRLDQDAFLRVMRDVGEAGYGRDSTTGLGKYAVEGPTAPAWAAEPALCAMTLAACAPDTRWLEPRRCFYQPVTRFGRHGNLAAVKANPFKRPILMVRRGAVLAFKNATSAMLHGRGLGGAGQPISTVVGETVHQGYAPLVPLHPPPDEGCFT